MFKDEAVIYVQSGRGGDGCVSFRREKFAPKGGPDGGDGGRGGNVVFVPTHELNSLADLHGRQRFVAENGRPGSGSNCAGPAGADLEILVPQGTIIRDRDRGHILKDLTTEDPFVALEGGCGGKGNARFSSSVNRVPRQFEPGKDGEQRWLTLDLKLIADIGLIGLPNAGKSTLLSRISGARPKIAAYPFTTLSPHLGIVEWAFRAFVVADIPGLIEGAHEGHGLGDQFLRHVERTRFLAHLIDGADETQEPIDAYNVIRRELGLYSPALVQKPTITVVTKIDAVSDLDALLLRCDPLPRPVFFASSASGRGIRELVGALAERLQEMDREDHASSSLAE